MIIDNSWCLLPDIARSGDPQQAIDYEAALIERVAAGTLPPTIWLWRNASCLCVSQKDRRLPGFFRAESEFNQMGMPVTSRSSGGTAVIHGPGVVNLSLIYSLKGKAAFSVAESYLLLCNLVMDFLRSEGVDCSVSSVPGAFCDGKYNVTVAGKKIGGTAQRVVSRKGQQVVLSHIVILLDVDTERYASLINRFYELSESEVRIDANVMTSLASESDCYRDDDSLYRRFSAWLDERVT